MSFLETGFFLNGFCFQRDFFSPCSIIFCSIASSSRSFIVVEGLISIYKKKPNTGMHAVTKIQKNIKSRELERSIMSRVTKKTKNISSKPTLSILNCIKRKFGSSARMGTNEFKNCEIEVKSILKVRVFTPVYNNVHNGSK